MSKGRLRASRRAYLLAHVFELLLGVMAVLPSVAFLLDPATRRRSSVGAALAPFDVIWNVGYLAAGIALVLGIVLANRRVEAVGLCLLAGGIFVNLAAAISVAGFVNLAGLGLLAAVILACIARLSVLSGRTVIEVELRAEDQDA